MIETRKDLFKYLVKRGLLITQQNDSVIWWISRDQMFAFNEWFNFVYWDNNTDSPGKYDVFFRYREWINIPISRFIELSTDKELIRELMFHIDILSKKTSPLDNVK